MRRGNAWFVLGLAGFLAGCGGDGADAGGVVGSGAAISGLYAQVEGERRGQLCLVQREGRAGSFGFVTWGRGDANCSGSGSVRREGDRLTLQLDADDSCALEARFDAGKVQVTRGFSAECERYYCAGGARIAGAEFLRGEEGNAAAGKARDVAGEALCGEAAAG